MFQKGVWYRYCNILYWIEFHVTSGRNYTNIHILLGLELFHNLNHGKIWMLEQEFQTWGLCWQSQRNDKTYNPGSISSGISTKSLKIQWLWWCGRFIMAHSDPSGVVPTFVLTIGLGTISSGKLSWWFCQKSPPNEKVQVVFPKILWKYPQFWFRHLQNATYLQISNAPFENILQLFPRYSPKPFQFYIIYKHIRHGDRH